jgi:hypothetical protein
MMAASATALVLRHLFWNRRPPEAGEAGPETAGDEVESEAAA